jgi:hypothetical protein
VLQGMFEAAGQQADHAVGPLSLVGTEGSRLDT